MNLLHFFEKCSRFTLNCRQCRGTIPATKGKETGYCPKQQPNMEATMKEETLNVNKIELGILGMALFELYQIE